ncbi:hypothetical protein KSB_04220 [Ktedonobacter robiniae]|uniref:Uncharacterized protein n=1 Tax=Ktedonobacter robiniae TaxID=2778365 RepID=A0ABQ3UGX2_9CHLR|nr:hypothetical protein KSB_04220 [Ktedonobacter robiniae]
MCRTTRRKDVVLYVLKKMLKKNNFDGVPGSLVGYRRSLFVVGRGSVYPSLAGSQL